MKKSTLLPALAIATLAAATLSLPATASADTFRHDGRETVARGDHLRDGHNRPVHGVVRRSSEPRHPDHRGWVQPDRHQYDRGHHYGHHHRDEQRYEYRPIVRQEYRRYDYRPVEVYQVIPSDDIRVRISYDLHL
jgi:Ni/Co efflux regulator RcnB